MGREEEVKPIPGRGLLGAEARSSVLLSGERSWVMMEREDRAKQGSQR